MQSKSVNNGLLYSGIKNLLRCDEAKVVGGIADFIIAQHRGLRVLSKLLTLSRKTGLPACLTLLAWLTSYFAIRSPHRSIGGAWIARLSNERNAIEPFLRMAPDLAWTELRFRSRIPIPDVADVQISNLRSTMRVFRIARRMHLRFAPFKALRVVELLGYYARYIKIFSENGFHLALTSNHSNPHGIAFNLAARKFGIPVVLISHGMPVRPVARLKYELAVIHCEAARQMYVADGCQMNLVLIHGRKQDYQPMRTQLPRQIKVGIFLSKDVNATRLSQLIKNLLSNSQISHICLRPHPKNLWFGLYSWVASYNDSRLSVRSGVSVRNDLTGIDVVFGGNSSVLVDAVTAGRPSGYIDGLDYGPWDLHKFVSHGLIYPSKLAPDFGAMLRFYQQSRWQQVLLSFSNIDEYESAVLESAKSAIAQCHTNTLNSNLSRGGLH